MLFIDNETNSSNHLKLMTKYHEDLDEQLLLIEEFIFLLKESFPQYEVFKYQPWDALSSFNFPKFSLKVHHKLLPYSNISRQELENHWRPIIKSQITVAVLIYLKANSTTLNFYIYR